ncbi:MAG: CZB domain-containing protein [Sulfuricurvum sp.]|uniref:CZB domain-containing protein n=1 Tax=Sulfuricurvum sp. TaxID=2025608 RepID=UPI0027352BD7|nr:CZB domain-containing protein [Sulfuricurvum sp.]MDP2849592.1 CZB domain-containing protein [Sulfuricurvum sp.]
MDKTLILQSLGEAKKAHLKWVQRAKLLIEGLAIDESAIPLNSTDCAFGKWFYSEGQKLNALGNMGCLSDIEKAHFTLHDEYMQIFKIYFSDNERTFFSKIFNSKKKINEKDKEIAKGHFMKLQAASDEVLEHIGRLERRLNAISQSSFDANMSGI